METTRPAGCIQHQSFQMTRQNRWFFIAASFGLAIGLQVVAARADDVQVNTYTTGNQRQASVALDADGDFVVVWASFGGYGTDPLGWDVQGQRYASDGSASGNEFRVNTYSSNNQVHPAVAMDAEGDFIVVWASQGSFGTDTVSFSIQGQRFASDGSPQGGQFQVNTYMTSSQWYPAISADAGGDFVVVWESLGSGGTDSFSYSVRASATRRTAPPWVANSRSIPTHTSFRAVPRLRWTRTAISW